MCVCVCVCEHVRGAGSCFDSPPVCDTSPWQEVVAAAFCGACVDNGRATKSLSFALQSGGNLPAVHACDQVTWAGQQDVVL